MESVLQFIFWMLSLYLILGVLFAIVFLWKGVGHIDVQARESGFFFKLLIFPGITFLWIVLLRKWIKSKKA